MSTLAKAKEELALKLAKAEGLIEGLTEASVAGVSDARVKEALASAEGFRQALAILAETVDAPVQAKPPVPYVPAYNPIDAQQANAVPQFNPQPQQSYPGLPPRLAAKAKRIQEAKK